MAEPSKNFLYTDHAGTGPPGSPIGLRVWRVSDIVTGTPGGYVDGIHYIVATTLRKPENSTTSPQLIATSGHSIALAIIW